MRGGNTCCMSNISNDCTIDAAYKHYITSFDRSTEFTGTYASVWLSYRSSENTADVYFLVNLGKLCASSWLGKFLCVSYKRFFFVRHGKEVSRGDSGIFNWLNLNQWHFWLEYFFGKYYRNSKIKKRLSLVTYLGLFL